jgi:hypothetical protein
MVAMHLKPLGIEQFVVQLYIRLLAFIDISINVLFFSL